MLKKRLVFGQEPHKAEEDLALMNVMQVDGHVILGVENKEEESKDKKRHKKTDGTMSSGASSGSAASLEDGRRTQ
jgi:hypothetical protein